jgi:hypothetical protein
MEWVSIFTEAVHAVTVTDGRVNVNWQMANQVKRSQPSCTVPWIANLIIHANDTLMPRDRQQLIALIPRLMHAHRPNDDDAYDAVMFDRLATYLAAECDDVGPNHMSVSRVIDTLCKRRDIDRLLILFNDLLDIHKKSMVEIGEAVNDPEDSYIDDDTLAEILRCH